MKRHYMIMTLCFLMMWLVGCQKESRSQAAANRFITQAKIMEKNKIAVKRGAARNAPTPYLAAHLRDPFEIPVSEAVNKKYPDTILRDTALDTIKLIGVIIHDKQSWAIIRTNKGKLYGLTAGTRVGMQHSLLTQIEENQVKFIQEVSTVSGIQNKEIVLRLQEPQEPKEPKK